MTIFWDTNLFIYLWEKKSSTREMTALVTDMETRRHTLATSALSLGEILVQPARQGQAELMVRYVEAMQRLVLIPFDAEAAICFANLRAAQPSLRPPDAIQLACAITRKCDLFLTNDNRLAHVTTPHAIKIQSLGDWFSEQQKLPVAR